MARTESLTGGAGMDVREPLAETVRQVVDLEQRERISMSMSEQIADHITALSGSMVFVWLNVFWFAAWIVLNSSAATRFDPGFEVLTMIVSLEAIFLSIFVLMSQNRQALVGDKRAKVDLQVNIIAEQEVTKVMELVAEIHNHLGLGNGHDAETEAMQQPTHVQDIADAIDTAEQELHPEAAKGPKSAVDTD